MLKLLDIPKGWFAQFMFKRALDVSAKQMEHQAYIQGKKDTLKIFVTDKLIKVTTRAILAEKNSGRKDCLIDCSNFSK